MFQREAEDINAAFRQLGVVLTASGLLIVFFEPSQTLTGSFISVLGLITIFFASPKRSNQ